MISQETKDIIEKDALEYSKANASNGVIEQEYRYCFEDYQAGATKYAEKLEEKDKEIATAQSEREGWNRISVDYAIALEKAEKIIESKDRELAQLKEEIIRLDKEIDLYRDALELDQLNRDDRVGFPKPFGL